MPGDFESFLNDQREQATQPAAPTPPPDSFEAFMSKVKSEQDAATLQSANATTVVNVQQGSTTAAAAAPVARQLGLPQPAVEADLPRFQQQAKTEAASALLARNPVLARWVAANPDSARIAQDEYQQLASIEQIFSAGTDSLGSIGYAGLQSLASSYNSAALGINRQLGALARILGPQAAGDWWQQNMVAPRADAQADLALPAGAGIGQRAAATVGNLLGLLSQITLTGGAGEAAPATASAGEALAQAGQTAARAMAFPSLTAATNKGAEVFERTGDRAAAIKATLAEYLFTTLQGAVPFSAPGGLAVRALSGAASGVAVSEGQRGAMNLLMPEQLQQQFDPQEALFQALSGAVLGGVMGPHNAPDYLPAIRQTYVDALKAEQAERDIGKVAALGQISANSKLREADPQAFRQFVETVSDSSKLDAVYIDAKELAGALAQSKVDITSVMPGVKAQIGEGLLTGTDVRIPVADFAAHIAGTDLEAALIPNLKAAPDGMTFKDGQAFYQDAAKNMEARAKEIADGAQQGADAQGYRQQVFDNVLAQLQATGRFPDSVAKGYATLIREFYGTQAERMGTTAGDLFAKMPLRVGAEGQGGLEQGHGPVALLTGKELPDLSLESARTWFKENLQGTTIRREGLGDVRVSGKGWNKLKAGIKSNPDKAALIPAIPAIIQRGEYLGRFPIDKERSDNIVAFHHFAADVQLRNETVRAGVSVAEDDRGNLFYNLNKDPESLLEKRKAPSEPRNEARGSEPSEESSTRSGPAHKAGAGEDDGTLTQSVGEDHGGINLSVLDQTGGEAKGLFQPSTNTIALLKNADLTTFLHESGHAFLEMTGRLAEHAEAPADLKADFDTLAKWMGAKDGADFRAKSLEDQRAGHEKFARAFEAYLMEGRAPTRALQPLFSRFRSWLVNVYKSLRGLETTAGQDISITPEVRAVMDRLVASDTAIRETEASRGYLPLFKTAKEAGMTEEQFAAYTALGEEATQHALDTMQAKSVQDLQYATNAKSRAIRELQKRAAAARKAIRAESEKQVAQMPVFKLQDYLAGVKNYDPDIVANAHGFEDAHHMEQAIAAAGSRQDVIENLTDLRMLQEHGELIDPQAVERAANEAVHNEARARFMATGLKILTKSPLPAAQIAKAAQQAATVAIGAKKIGEINPKAYLAAEDRANRDAVAAAAKSPREAIEAQRTAVLANRLARAAQDALAEVDRGLRYLRRFDNPQTAAKVGAEYMDRINELLSAYDLSSRFASKADVQTRQDMRSWLQSEFERTGVMPEVSDALLDFTQRRQWKELPFEEFLGLVDAAKSLEHVGRGQTQLTLAGKAIQLDDLVQRAKADMADMPHSQPVDLQPHLQHASGLDKLATQWLHVKQKVRGMDAALVKMEQLFQWLTYGRRSGLGEARSGPFLEIFQRAADAEGAERSMRAQSTEDMRRLGQTLRDAKVNLNESLQLPLQRPERGGHWYRSELIAAALNTGNEGNLKKLTDGYHWDRAQLQEVLNTHLSKAEWQFVQGIWDAIGKYGPQIEAMQKRLTGVAPEMVQPLSVATPHGNFKGGYYPVVYDAFLDRSIEWKYAKDSAALFENQFSKPTTSHGHTVARTGYVGPVQLSLGVIGRHIDQVTHDLAWREAIADMNKFLSHKEVMSEVDQVMGREYTKQFRPWLQAMANDKVFNTAGDSAWESFYRKARTNATMVGLGFRLSTMLIHGGSALSNSIGEVGVKWFAKGAAEFATPERWERAKQFMYERSPEMANRFNEFDRNVREAINEINEHQKSLGVVSATQKTVDAARRFAFYGVQALDMGSAAPTWMAAYLKGMSPQAKGGLGMSEEAAVDYANRAVRNAHGGGGTKDLSAVQRDKGVLSLATMFYSFWNHMYNRQRDIAKGFANLPESVRQGTGTRDFAKLLARSFFYFAIPQLIHAALKPSPQDQQDDSLEGHLAHLAEEIPLGFVSGVPVLRDLANAAINGRDYAITPLEQAGKAIVKATVDTTKYLKGEEPSAHAAKNAVMAAGYIAGLPVGQAATAGPFLWDVFNGNADAQGIKDWYSGVTHGRIEQ